MIIGLSRRTIDWPIDHRRGLVGPNMPVTWLNLASSIRRQTIQIHSLFHFFKITFHNHFTPLFPFFFILNQSFQVTNHSQIKIITSQTSHIFLILCFSMFLQSVIEYWLLGYFMKVHLTTTPLRTKGTSISLEFEFLFIVVYRNLKVGPLGLNKLKFHANFF